MIGLLLIWEMPSDLIIMLTVGVNLAHNGASPFAAQPFVVAIALMAALPMLAYLLFRRARSGLRPRCVTG